MLLRLGMIQGKHVLLAQVKLATHYFRNSSSADSDAKDPVPEVERRGRGRGRVLGCRRARARGRVGRILKPFSNLTIIVSEKEGE